MPRWDYMGLPLRQSGWKVWKSILGLILTLLLVAVTEPLAVNVMDAMLPQGTSTDIYEGLDQAACSEDSALLLLLAAVPQALVIAGLGLVMFLTHERSIGTVFSEEGRLRPRNLVRVWPAVLLMIGLMALVLLDPASWAEEHNTLSPIAIVMSAVGICVSAAYEEFFFRGYLRQTMFSWLGRIRVFGSDKLSRRITAVASTLVVTLIFATLHPYDVLGLTDVLLFALLACWLTDTSGGIEASIMLHFCHNFTTTILCSFLPVIAKETNPYMVDISAMELSDVIYLIESSVLTIIPFVLAIWLTSSTAKQPEGEPNLVSQRQKIQDGEKPVPIVKRILHILIVAIPTGVLLLQLMMMALGLFPTRFAGTGLEPEVHAGDILICHNVTDLTPLHTNDIVYLVLDEPIDGHDIFLKRIKGVPGDVVTVEGQEVTLGDDEYAVEYENDSGNVRNIIIKRDSIVGTAKMKLFPFASLEQSEG